MPSLSKAEKAARELARNKKGECVRVVVRCRPLSSKERQDGRTACAKVDDERSTIALRDPKADAGEPPKTFTFDQVYGANALQRVIYDRTASGIVDGVLEGYNGTVFAYGQTGAGKTHTMEGLTDPPEQRGIIPNAFKHIFQKIDLEGAEDKQFLVRASYLEIYNDEIRDLLSKDPKHHLELKEHVDSGVYVKDQKVEVVKSVAEIDQVMQTGKKYRSVGTTLMNQTSSRSHSIFTIIIETCQTNATTGEDHIRVGKLNLVDLAGSERQSKTGATDQRLKEATKINLSLSALGNVISALVESKSQHIPYRDSKLTRLLQDSLGGNTKTVMIANCGPADYNYDETMSTLRYANRAKNIKNKPKVNEDPKDAMLREFQDEIKRLKNRLSAAEAGRPIENIDGLGGDGDPRMPGGSASRMLSEKQLKELKEEMAVQAKEEHKKIQKQADERMKKILEEKEFTEREKKELEEKAMKAAATAHRHAKAKEHLQKQLKAVSEKLLTGVDSLNQAAIQEEKLRQAQRELQERRDQERKLAEELAAKEENLLIFDEKYNSLQEEVDVKTKKLKKLWNKYQEVKREAKDLHNEFQGEREDMLETIRELTRQLKLKELVLEHFVPPDEAERINMRAKWDDESGQWNIARIEFAGNLIRPRRPRTNRHSREPETEFAKQKREYDNNARFRRENTVDLALDMPESTTQDYDGAAMSSRVDAALNSALQGDEEEEIDFDAPENLPDFNPYLQYEDDKDERERDRDRDNRDRRRKKEKRKSTRKRPGSAARRGRSSRSSSSSQNKSEYNRDIPSGRGAASSWLDDDFGDTPSEYPSARGLVGRR